MYCMLFSQAHLHGNVYGPDSAIFNHVKLPLASGGIMGMSVVAESGPWRRSCNQRSKCGLYHWSVTQQRLQAKISKDFTGLKEIYR